MLALSLLSPNVHLVRRIRLLEQRVQEQPGPEQDSETAAAAADSERVTELKEENAALNER